MSYTKLNLAAIDAVYRLTNSHVPEGIAQERIQSAQAGNYHPDGKAWSKCCCGDKDIASSVVNCAFIDKRITKGTAGALRADTPFPCVHRLTEDSCTRICAGWDACFGAAWRKRHGHTP